MGKISNFFENWTKALKLFAIPHTILGGLTCYGMYLVNNHTTGERKVMFALVLGLLISFLGPLLTLHCEGNPQKIR